MTILPRGRAGAGKTRFERRAEQHVFACWYCCAIKMAAASSNKSKHLHADTHIACLTFIDEGCSSVNFQCSGGFIVKLIFARRGFAASATMHPTHVRRQVSSICGRYSSPDAVLQASGSGITRRSEIQWRYGGSFAHAITLQRSVCRAADYTTQVCTSGATALRFWMLRWRWKI